VRKFLGSGLVPLQWLDERVDNYLTQFRGLNSFTRYADFWFTSALSFHRNWAVRGPLCRRIGGGTKKQIITGGAVGIPLFDG
jgi:hypothetical protein